MSTIKATLQMYWQENKYDTSEGAGKFVLFSSEGMDEYGYVYVGPVTVEVPTPENFDPRAGKLRALREQERKVRAEFARRITELQREIAECQALEMA